VSGRERITPRDDLKALEGYHSPQLDVSVRLNTNESPLPPPQGFVEAWLEALAAVPLHRYPDRSARRLRTAIAESLGQPAARLFCATGSYVVLQSLVLT
jgi:histidinol-phosphate aminotransferase